MANNAIFIMQRVADKLNNFLTPILFTNNIAGTRPKKSIKGVIKVMKVAVDLL